MPRVLKLLCGAELRRVRLEDDAIPAVPVADLIRSWMPSLGDAPFTVSYQDDEDETITMTSAAELAEAFRIADDCGRPSLKLTVVVAEAPAPAVPAPAAPAPAARAPSLAPTASSPTPPTDEHATAVTIAAALDKLRTVGDTTAAEEATFVQAAWRGAGTHTDPQAFSGFLDGLFRAAADEILARQACGGDGADPEPPLPSPPRVPVDQLRALVAVFRANPLALMTLPAILTDPHAAALMRELQASRSAAHALEIASESPHTPAVLRLPAMATFVAAAGIDTASLPPTASMPPPPPPPPFAGVPPPFGFAPPPPHGAAPPAGNPLTDLLQTLLSGAVPLAPAPTAPAPAPAANTGAPVHTRVICDNCDANPITGVRFKCAVCDDYDLCAACEAAGAHTQHALLKIARPELAPAGIVTVLAPGQDDAGAPQPELTADTDSDWRGLSDGLGGILRRRLSRMGARCHRGRGWRRGRGRGGSRSASRDEPAKRRATGGAADDDDLDTQLMRAAVQESLNAAAAEADAPTADAPTVDAPAGVEEAKAGDAAKPALPVVVVAPEAPAYVARFVTHVTLVDTTPVNPGRRLTKAWRMRNEGGSPWPEGTRLVHVGAELMGGPAEGVPVAPVAPGDCVDISLDLEAPAAPGRHVGYWRLVTPDGVRFGHRVWADIFVDNSNAADIVAAALKREADSAPEPAPAPPAEPAPEPAPVDVTPSAPDFVVVPETVYGSQLATLGDMGFTHTPTNVQLLDRYNGDVERVLNHLLSA